MKMDGEMLKGKLIEIKMEIDQIIVKGQKTYGYSKERAEKEFAEFDQFLHPKKISGNKNDVFNKTGDLYD